MDISNENKETLPEDASSLLENQEQISSVNHTKEKEMTPTNEKTMTPIPWYKYVPSTIVAILLIWKPLIVALFPGFIYTSDLTQVFLFQGCVGKSTQTVFVFCLLEVLTACVLLKKIVVPAMFRVETWKSFHHLKLNHSRLFEFHITIRCNDLVPMISMQ